MKSLLSLHVSTLSIKNLLLSVAFLLLHCYLTIRTIILIHAKQIDKVSWNNFSASPASSNLPLPATSLAFFAPLLSGATRWRMPGCSIRSRATRRRWRGRQTVLQSNGTFTFSPLMVGFPPFVVVWFFSRRRTSVLSSHYTQQVFLFIVLICCRVLSNQTDWCWSHLIICIIMNFSCSGFYVSRVSAQLCCVLNLLPPKLEGN